MYLSGKLTVIFGGVGAGKSSLLSALLGEMVTLDGRVEWKRLFQNQRNQILFTDISSM